MIDAKWWYIFSELPCILLHWSYICRIELWSFTLNFVCFIQKWFYLSKLCLYNVDLFSIRDGNKFMVWIFQEPSLFAVAKLLETGLVNLPRVEVLWRPLTNHLLEVCQHPHIRMREWGVEAVTYLVKAALQHKYQPPLRDNQVCQHQFILYSSVYSKIQYFVEVLVPLELAVKLTTHSLWLLGQFVLPCLYEYSIPLNTSTPKCLRDNKY